MSCSDCVKRNSFSLEIGWVDRKSDLRLSECSLGLSEFFWVSSEKSEVCPHLKVEFSYRLDSRSDTGGSV